MATFTSPTFNTSNQYIKYRLVIAELEQSIPNNTTKINVQLQAWRTNNFDTYGSGTAYIRINDSTYSAGINYTQHITLNSYTVLFNQDIIISHNSDGTKPISISGWIAHSQFSSTEQSYSFNLTTIPRTSSFTITDSSLYFGETINITIDRKSTSFTHDVKIAFGSYSQTLTGRTTSASYTIPDLWAGAIPNSLNGTGTVTVTTKSGSTTIGSTSHSFTLYIPSDMKPSFTSITSVPSPAFYSTMYLQSKSAASLSINGANGIYGSGIAKYEISLSTGFKSATRTATSPIFTTTGNIVVTATVTDTRGRTATKTIVITITAYAPPKLSAIIQRVNAEGVYDDSGTRVKIQPTVTITSLSDNNSITVLRYRQKKKIDTNFGSWVNMTNGTTYYFDADVSYDYDVEIEYKDEINASSTYSTVAPSEKRIMDVLSGGEGIAFGKSATQENIAEFGWKAVFSAGTEGIFEQSSFQQFSKNYTLSAIGNFSLGEMFTINRGYHLLIVTLRSNRDEEGLQTLSNIGYSVRGSNLGGGGIQLVQFITAALDNTKINSVTSYNYLSGAITYTVYAQVIKLMPYN